MQKVRVLNYLKRTACGVLTIMVMLTVFPFTEAYAAAAEVGKYGMTPIYGRGLADGTYSIQVESNSSFFKIISSSITVSGDDMKCSITIGSHSYPYLYLGTKKEAESADEKDWIVGEKDGDNTVYTFSLDSLNHPISCAAYSKRKKRWYDRKILFDAATLPAEALLFELPDYDAIEEALLGTGNSVLEINEGQNAEALHTPEEPAMEVPLEDGEYSIEVSMTGGTGRAAISSPTWMMVKDGRAYAKLLWSSSHYDWMKIGDQVFYNENTDGGNSYFIIPITQMDRIIQITADTTAMGDPVAINYSITFYADTIGDKGLIPQEAAKKVIMLSAAVTVVGGILNYIVKKKKRK